MPHKIPSICAGILIGAMSAPLLAETDLRIYENVEHIFENPEDYIDPKSIEILLAPGDDEKFRELAKEIQTSTHRRVNEEMQRLDFDEQTWAFTYDADKKVDESFGPPEAPTLLGNKGDVRYAVFLSFGMPEKEFNEALREIASRDDAFGVVIGLADKDGSIPDTMRELYRRSQNLGLDESPPVYIEPNLFEEHAVSSVPTVIQFDGSETSAVVKGVLNIPWLEDRVSEGHEGHLGQRGTIYEIAEESLLETIAKRMEKIDPEKEKQGALDRFWGNQRLPKLPVAQEDASYLVDLTFTVTETITTPGGQVIARRGDRFNPTKLLPFDRVGIVFDGSRPGQVEWAREEVERALDKNLVPIVMATDLNIGDDGWESFRKLNDSIPSAHVKLANDPILDRFQIAVVPSRFEQDGDKIRVTEFKLEPKE